MLSMAKLVSPGQAVAYYGKDNYYTRDELEDASQWFGEGARLLNLEGRVDPLDFEKILAGELPNGTVVGEGSNRDHRPGMDMTYSAPKSVSIMALVAGDDRLPRANMDAVKQTLAWAEINFAEARIHSGERTEVVKTGNLLVALFAHDTSRNLDPQLHVHAVVANATQTADGRWRAHHNDKLWSNNSLLGAIYHSFLRERVEALGYQTELTGKHGTFELTAISRETIELFSSRRQDILEKAASLGIESPQGLRAVANRTRDPKRSLDDRQQLYSTWEAIAAGAGVDLRATMARATARSGSTRSAEWRDISASPAAGSLARFYGEIKTYIHDLTSGHSENPFYVRPGMLPSRAEFTAAKSVASAVHHLSERETSFGKYDVAAAALHLGLQTNIHAIERQIDRMQSKGVLLPGTQDDKLTTRHARDVERQIIAEAERGRGQSRPSISDKNLAGERLQAFAKADKGFALNVGQETAGRQILSSPDRFLNVQGVAGAGKSSMLRPAAHILQEDGKQVLVLGVQNVLVQRLSKEIDVPAASVAKFIATHRHLLKSDVPAEKLEFARQQFRDSVIFIDESSMVSNDQALQLKKIANLVGVHLMVDIGDKRQLGAVEAGKPFELSQSTGVTTALMTENLRARAPDLRQAAFQANNRDTSAAFRTLKGRTISVGDKVGEIASERWLRLSPEDRSRTILMTSGRVLMEEVNGRVQDGLRAEGTLEGPATTITILDKEQPTRAELQSPATYEAGMRIEIQMDLRKSQGYKFAPARGQHQSGTVVAVDREKETVRFRLDSGKEHTLLPRKLPLDKDRDPVRLSRPRQIDIHKGDTLRWTETDHKRQIFSKGLTTILGITKAGVEVTNSQGVPITLPHDDPMLKRVDLAYALNTHQLQGATSDNAIAAARASETNLANARSFLVNITRPRDGLEIIVDDANRYADRIARNPGDKTSALETLGEVPTGPSREAVRVANSGLKAAGELPGQKLAASQSAAQLYKPPERQPDIADRPGGGARTRDFER